MTTIVDIGQGATRGHTIGRKEKESEHMQADKKEWHINICLIICSILNRVV